MPRRRHMEQVQLRLPLERLIELDKWAYFEGKARQDVIRDTINLGLLVKTKLIEREPEDLERWRSMQEQGAFDHYLNGKHRHRFPILEDESTADT